jgi:hypothetical protein
MACDYEILLGKLVGRVGRIGVGVHAPAGRTSAVSN